MFSVLSVGEIMQLQFEILGNAERGIKGLLNYELPVILKYNIRKLLQAIEPEVDVFNKTKDDLIKKYSNGGSSLEMNYADGKPNPEYEKCLIEINKVLLQEVRINHQIFRIEDLNFKTESDFPSFYKIIDNCLAQQNGHKEPNKKKEKIEQKE